MRKTKSLFDDLQNGTIYAILFERKELIQKYLVGGEE